MLVKDIIEHSIWLPSSEYGKYKPKISIFLPAYAKAKSGLLERVFDSILGQTFQEFELIVVDDASTDGTGDIIDAYMQRDRRISCIRHPQNIGLPAISEYEAFIKSSGQYIMFAFDDFIFEKDAFYKLYQVMTENNYDCCYGQAKSFYYEEGIERFVVLGAQPVYGDSCNNYLANSAVILKRTVLETIGLYDPHILLARECDWDLWQRISKRYFLQKVDIMVGAEYGVTQSNSLGNAYYNTLSCSRFYKMHERDEQLLPENFASKNIIESPLIFGSRERAYLEDLLDFYQSKFWACGLKSNSLNATKKIAFYSSSNINFHLCFESMNNTGNYKIQPVQFSGNILRDLYKLISYDAVIINRNLVYSTNLIALLKKLNITCYYYIDENPINLKKELVEFKWYSKKNMTKALKNVNAVLTSTETLKAFFIEEKLHSQVLCYPPVLNEALIATTSDRRDKNINIAVIGGLFRSEFFHEFVVPALNKLIDLGEKIHLTVRRNLLKPAMHSYKFTFNEVENIEDYNQYIYQLRKNKIDIIIHPYGKTNNSFYKTNSVLLNALYLNANIIVFGEPAYEGLGEKDGVINIQGDINAIVDSIKYVSISANSAFLKSNLKDYCYRAFSKDNNIRLLDKLINKETLNAVVYEKRVQELIKYITKIDSPTVNVQSNTYKSIQHCFDHLIKGVHDIETIPQFKATLSTLKYQQDGKGLNLKKGLCLNKKIYIEYCLDNFHENLSEITIACSGPSTSSQGLIGIELILPDGTISVHCTKSLSGIDFLAPITFDFSTVDVPVNEKLFLRVFLRDADIPVSVYELHSPPKLLPFRKKNKQVFCMLS